MAGILLLVLILSHGRNKTKRHAHFSWSPWAYVKTKSCQILSQMMQNETKITTACFSSLPLPHVHQVLHNKRVNFHSSPHLGSILHCTVASLQPTTALCFVLAMEESSISTAKSILLIFTKEQIAITRWPRQHKHMA